MGCVQWAILLGIFGPISCAATYAQHAEPIAIRNVRVVVGDGSVIDSATVRILGGRIVYVGDERDVVRPDAAIIDGQGLTMLPGLIDVHVHLFAGSRGIGRSAHERELKEDVPKRLAGYLRAGVTTIKSAGDPTSLILQLRNDLRQQPSTGPRLLVTGPGITTPNGWPTSITGEDRWWRSEHCREVTTREEVKRTIQTLAAQGVDAIKLYHDGGPLAPDGDTFPKLPIDVLQAAIEEAHRHKLRATVHTWSAPDALRAIKAGADGLEHGIVADIAPPELFRLMVERKAFYVATLSVYRFANRDEVIGLRNLRLAHQTRVPVALGSDTFTSPPMGIDPQHGENTWTEFEWMVKSGMTHGEVVRAATRDAAEHLGILDETGTIEVGKCADVILTAVDPLKEIPKIEEIVIVLRAGKIVRDYREASVNNLSPSD